ncbi:DUF4292 domain-containing protein [Corallibacter sp.]|uniref:DUF4292 domain-containing protein n=1 Tax=Corallibacter sp. TaxID=2038084 RepID=UPI003AB54538
MNKISIIKCLLVVTCVMCLVGCKSSKIATDGTKNLKLSAKEVIKINDKNAPDFKTFQARVKASYTQDTKSQTHTVTMRIQKDEIIWINSALNLIRLKITPQSVQFYNKLDNTYFDGDFAYLSNLLGTDLDFEKVQNLLLGNALFPLNKADYKMSIHDEAYLFQPHTQTALFELFYVVSAVNFKMQSQQLAQATESRFLEIDYLQYQNVDNQILPEQLKVIALEGDSETIIEMEFKSVSLNEDLRYPFKIPSGFKEIRLE